MTKYADEMFDRLKLAVYLARLKPDYQAGMIARDALHLIRQARSFQALAVAACNYELTSRQVSRRGKIADNIAALASSYGLGVDLSGDPRGYVVRLTGGDIPSNNLGGGYGLI